LLHRCDRNRKRSKRRAIYCQLHGGYLDSVSKKYHLYADRAGQLEQRGISRLKALTLIANHTTILLENEWLEAFWCDDCQGTKWYYIHRQVSLTPGKPPFVYKASLAPEELWQQVGGLIHPNGNPSVSEFTSRNSRRVNYQGIKDFRVIS
jgi:hypothetical protein